jgi:hypothetical protein
MFKYNERDMPIGLKKRPRVLIFKMQRIVSNGIVPGNGLARESVM